MAIEFEPFAFSEDHGSLKGPRLGLLGIDGATAAAGDFGLVRGPRLGLLGEAGQVRAYAGTLTGPTLGLLGIGVVGDVGILPGPPMALFGADAEIDLSIDVGILPGPPMSLVATDDQVFVYHGELRGPRLRVLGVDGHGDVGIVPGPTLGLLGFAPKPVASWWSAAEPAPVVRATGAPGALIRAVLDGVRLAAATEGSGVLVLLERLRVRAEMTLSLEVLERLRTSIALSDDPIGIVLAQLTEAIRLADQPDGMAIIARELVDGIALAGGWTATQEVLALIATTLALADHGHPAETALVADTLALSDAVLTSATDYMRVLERLRLDDVPRGTALLTALVSERFSLSDQLTTSAELLKLLREAMALRVEVQDGDAPFVAWVLNAESRAAWTYENWPFNSYAEIDGRQYAAGPTGIVELGGDDDDGEAIAAKLRTGLSNLGTGRLKRIEAAYLGYTSDGQLGLAVTVTSPTGEKSEHRYLMRPQPAQAMREGRVKVGRGMKSVFWQLELFNVDGADFELHNLELLPMILDRSI